MANANTQGVIVAEDNTNAPQIVTDNVTHYDFLAKPPEVC